MNISVCLAAYNGMPFIHEQIDSILRQLNSGDELIISDGGSNDGTREYLTEKLGSICNVRLFFSSVRLEPVANFEVAMSFASKDIIILSDQDDVWLDNKIEVIRSSFSNDHDLMLLTVNASMYRWDGKQYHIDGNLFDCISHRHGVVSNLLRNTYVGCCMSFRSSVLSVALPFPAGLPMHDVWIGIVANLLGRVSTIHQPYMLYRRHSNNYSQTGGKSNFSLIEKIMFRCSLLTGLLSVSKKIFSARKS